MMSWSAGQDWVKASSRYMWCMYRHRCSYSAGTSNSWKNFPENRNIYYISLLETLPCSHKCATVASIFHPWSRFNEMFSTAATDHEINQWKRHMANVKRCLWLTAIFPRTDDKYNVCDLLHESPNPWVDSSALVYTFPNSWQSSAVCVSAPGVRPLHWPEWRDKATNLSLYLSANFVICLGTWYPFRSPPACSSSIRVGHNCAPYKLDDTINAREASHTIWWRSCRMTGQPVAVFAERGACSGNVLPVWEKAVLQPA